MAHSSIADSDDRRDGHCCSFETTRYLHHDPKALGGSFSAVISTRWSTASGGSLQFAPSVVLHCTSTGALSTTVHCTTWSILEPCRFSAVPMLSIACFASAAMPPATSCPDLSVPMAPDRYRMLPTLTASGNGRFIAAGTIDYRTGQ